MTETAHIDLAHASAEASVPTLFKHKKRDEWGLGIVLRRLDDRIDIQFQDGRERTFKHGFYHMFEAVDRRLDVAMGIVDALRSMSGDTAPRGDRKQPVTLEEQVVFFRQQYREGFRGEAFGEAHRGDGRKRPLKRHRDALVASAAEHLAKRSLLEALTDDDPSAVHEAAGHVISSTDLVKVAERKLFLEMDAQFHAPVANALHALLHGKSPLVPRIDAVVAWLERALGDTPSWELVTVLLGAVHPNEHVVVRENVFSRQAVFMAPGLTIPKRPMGILYERLQTMAQSVRAHLLEEGLEPRDMLDVHDFMWLTLKPASQRSIRERRQRLRLNPELAEKDTDREAA